MAARARSIRLPALAATLRTLADRGVRRLLRRRPRRADRPRARRRRGRAHARRPARPPQHVGDADRHDVPRRPRHDPPAQQQRRCSPSRSSTSSSGSSRRPAPAFDGSRLDRCRPGRTAGSRRPSSSTRTGTRSSPTRRSGTCPWTRLLSGAHADGARRADRPAAGGSRRRPRRGRSSAGRSGWASWTATGNAVSLIQSNAAGFGSGVAGPGDRGPLPEPGRLVLARPGAPQRPGAGQADGAHAAARDAVPGRRAAPMDRRRARWAATSSPRSTPSWCRRSSTAGRTSRPRSPRRGSPWSPTAGSPRRCAVLADGPLAPGRDGRAPRASATGWARSPTPAAWATSTRSSWWTAGRPAGGSLAAATDPRAAGLPAVR